MNPLESRKQLLIAESEMNRAHFAEDAAILTGNLRVFTRQVRPFSSIVSAAAALVSSMLAWQQRKTDDAPAQPSWVQTLLKTTGMVSTLWQAFRQKSSAPENQP